MRSDPPLDDSYHLGRSVINDFGRPVSEGFATLAGASASARFSRFSAYLRAEYQQAHAPGTTASMEREFAAADRRPERPARAGYGVSRGRVLEGYVAVNLANTVVSLGKQSLWWSSGRGGAMLLANKPSRC